MKRAIIHCVLMALLFSACGTAKRSCRRAEGYIQKAVRVCPEAAQLHTDTVVITVPADSVTITATYIDPDRDSLRAVISQLSEALQAERELSVIEGTGSNAVVKHAVHQAIDRVRQKVCWFPTRHVESETARGMMWWDPDGTPHCRCWSKALRFTEEITSPQVVVGPVEVKDATAWWVWPFVWSLIAMLAGSCLILFLAMRNWRSKYNATLS